MNKKIMLLALAVVSTMLFALPGVASAQEAHIEGITSFSGTGGASTIVASGEPTITCESVDANSGALSAGGTTGSVSLRLTGCHASVFFTLKCKTTFSGVDNAIEMSGTLHVITVNNKPGVLMTPALTEIICAGISSTIVGGLGVIGTITSPACGVSSKVLTVSFSALGESQNHQTYTAFTEVHLTTKTSGGSALAAGFTSTITLSSFAEGKLNCT
jgi:uncharacterized protein YsxB (DUF464 family)